MATPLGVFHKERPAAASSADHRRRHCRPPGSTDPPDRRRQPTEDCGDRPRPRMTGPGLSALGHATNRRCSPGQTPASASRPQERAKRRRPSRFARIDAAVTHIHQMARATGQHTSAATARTNRPNTITAAALAAKQPEGMFRPLGPSSFFTVALRTRSWRPGPSGPSPPRRPSGSASKCLLPLLRGSECRGE